MEFNENLKAFFEKFADDEELQVKMSQVTNPDEAYALASSVQSGFTKEEFVEAMKQLQAATGEEISDEDMEQVAGGKFNFSKFKNILTKVAETVSAVVSKAAKSAAA